MRWAAGPASPPTSACSRKARSLWPARPLGRRTSSEALRLRGPPRGSGSVLARCPSSGNNLKFASRVCFRWASASEPARRSV
jgi:hypothetical protein